jgi:glycosyltransferase involved in cell wall biosynthesis
MKILHVCLAAFYIDNYGYQENVLPKMHMLQGHDVEILASTETYLNGNEMSYLEPSVYRNEDNITVTRLPYLKVLNHFISRKLRFYNGVSKKLKEFKPDIIFLHDVQFLGIFEVIKFLKKNPQVVVYADGHADLTNSATNWLSRYILHGIVYKYCARKIDKYVKRFYGTLPCRVDFFRDFYGVTKSKVELLVMGVDDTLIDFDRKKNKEELFKKHDIFKDDFVIISGGKLNEKKNIHHLVDAIVSIDDSRLKLILFGKPDAKVKKLIENKLKHKSIIYLSWLNNIEIHKYLAIADLCVFPGKHSVLWEQAAGIGVPGIYKNIQGHDHIDLGGNCILIDEGNTYEIKQQVLNVVNNKELYNKLLKTASTKGKKAFSYYEIAKRAIS